MNNPTENEPPSLALKISEDPNQFLVNEIVNTGPAALQRSLLKVHSMALYNSEQLSKEEITALWYVDQLQSTLLHYATKVGDVN